MKDVREKAEYLFSELGYVEDALLAAAIRPRVAARRSLSVNMRRVLILAAALGVAASLTVGVLVVGSLRGANREDSMAIGNEVTAAAGTSASLNSLLQRAEQRADVQHLTEEQIDLFDGGCRVVWQREGQSDYCVKVLEASDAAAELTAALGDAELQKSGEEPVAVRVWFCLGDGRVVSPYLAASEGNVGYGDLFDYEPEGEPDRELVRAVEALMNRS